MSSNIHCTYISEKISKIRWRPTAFGDPHSFVTASWDNEVNHIRLWELNPRNSEEGANPYEIQILPFNGDITELKFLNPDQILASSSEGGLYLLKVTLSNTDEVDICEEIHWEKLHSFKNDFKSSCTSFATYDNDVATVGEDGTINLLSIKDVAPKQIFREADSCVTNCVIFVKFNELLTSNSRGQMMVWDLRNNHEKPSNIFMLNSDNLASTVAATCLAFHPTQRHVVASGDEQGSLTIWDLRHNTYPVNVCTSHTDAVSEVHFHPDRPARIFSCSEAGDVFHWTDSTAASSFNPDPWYMSTSANKYSIFRLMPELHTPVNTLDLSRNRLLCGADNEAMYLIDEIDIYN